MGECGNITVLVGPMFSRKTSEIVVEIERIVLGKKSFIAFKPKTDTRLNRSLDEKLAEALKRYNIDVDSKIFYVDNDDEFRFRVTESKIDVIVIDEAQFFNHRWIIEEVKFAAWSLGIDVLVAGLDLDYARQPFGVMPEFLAIADEVHKLKAVCGCGRSARFTQRVSGSDKQILVDTGKEYEARCGNCYRPYKSV